VDCNGVTPTFAPKFTLTLLLKTICVAAYANVIVMRANATNNGMYRLLSILVDPNLSLYLRRADTRRYTALHSLKRIDRYAGTFSFLIKMNQYEDRPSATRIASVFLELLNRTRGLLRRLVHAVYPSRLHGNASLPNLPRNHVLRQLGRMDGRD